MPPNWDIFARIYTHLFLDFQAYHLLDTMIGAKEIMNNILFSMSFQFNTGKQTKRHHNEISVVLRDWYGCHGTLSEEHLSQIFGSEISWMK